MDEVRSLKKLKSQLKGMLENAEALKAEAAEKQREYSEKMNQIRSMEQQISKLENNGKVKISEHAVLRYLERVKGIDVADIEKEILSPEILEMVKKLGGNGTYPGNGYRIIMKNYTVTTVI